MKRYYFLILALAFCIDTFAQAVTPDTIVGRCPRFYYEGWYDTCGEWLQNHYPRAQTKELSNGSQLLKVEYTTKPLAVKGLAILVDEGDPYRRINPDDDLDRLPEYLYLSQYRGGDDTLSDENIAPIDSVRWDTAQVKHYLLEDIGYVIGSELQIRDSVYNIYEGYFSKGPILVDSLFFIFAEQHNGEKYYDPLAHQHWFVHKPYRFASIGTIYSIYNTGVCGKENAMWARSRAGGYFRDWENEDLLQWGVFFAIVDFVDVNGYANDTLMGHVEGSDRYSEQTMATLTAVAEPGYRFMQWADGSTQNPRDIYLTQDTSIEAIFAPRQIVEIDDPRLDTLLTIASMPQEFYFQIAPNPAHAELRVMVKEQNLPAQLSLINAWGTTLLNMRLTESETTLPLTKYPDGVYFVRLTNGKGQSLRKLIIR